MPYDPDFLAGVTIPLPTLLPAVAEDAWSGGEPIHHTNHSVVLNQERALAVYAAHNVDGDRLVPGIRRRGFTFDPEVPNQIQIDNDRGYRGFPDPESNPWDAGHLARRKDVHWPDASTAKQAERDTSRWTNIAPQHGRLNRGPWKNIEDWLLRRADAANLRMSVFTGPVFTATDMVWQNKDDELEIRIPSGYWKIGMFRSAGTLRAAAFLIWQTDVVPSVDDFDPDDFDPVLEQVRVLTIEHLAGLSFGDLVRAADPLHFGERVPEERSETDTTPTPGLDVVGGGFDGGISVGGTDAGPALEPSRPAGPRVSSVAVGGPGDIVI